MKGERINFVGTVASLVLVSVLSCYCWPSSQACLAEEREALLQIKNSIDHHPNCSGWRSWEGKNWVGENCCKWEGIRCSNSTYRVVKINILYGRAYDCGRWYPNATWFAQLEELQELHLVENSIGGWIMAEAFRSMNHLQILDLSYNEMNESFVCVWENMTSLRELHLSDSHFDQIPLCLGEMRFLKTLNLAGNQLHGKIPSFLGEIPYEGHSTTFTECSFIGNPSLCGQPLSQNCHLNIPSESVDKNEKEKSGLLQNELFFYSCVAICYALGFWCFIGVLIFKKNLRKSYYRVIDQSLEFCVVKLQGFVHYVRVKFHNV